MAKLTGTSRRGGRRKGSGRVALTDFMRGTAGSQRCLWIVAAVRKEAEREIRAFADHLQRKNDEADHKDLRRRQDAMRRTPLSIRKRELVLSAMDPDDPDPTAPLYVSLWDQVGKGNEPGEIDAFFKAAPQKPKVKDKTTCPKPGTLERYITIDRLSPRRMGAVYQAVLARARYAVESLDRNLEAMRIARTCRHVRAEFSLPDGPLEAQYDLETHRGLTAWAMDTGKFSWHITHEEPRAGGPVDAPLRFLRGLTRKKIKRCIAAWTALEDSLGNELHQRSTGLELEIERALETLDAIDAQSGPPAKTLVV